MFHRCQKGRTRQQKLLFLWSSWKVLSTLFPKGEALAGGNGLFYWGAEEPEPLLSSSALPRGSFQLCLPSRANSVWEKKAGLKAARRLLCCKGFALYNPL